MSVDTKGLRRLERAFAKVRAEVAGLSGGLAQRLEREMGTLDAGQNVQVFKRETDPETNKRWGSLSPKYLRWKRAHSRSKKKLVLGGDLKRSLIARSQTGKRVIQMRSSVMHLGTRHRLGGIHMRGGPHLPARPMVGKTRAQLREQEKAALKHIQDAIGRALGGSVGRGLVHDAGRIKPKPGRW